MYSSLNLEDAREGTPVLSQNGSRMILDLLENPEQADNEVIAVHDQADSDKADQRKLLVTDHFARVRIEALDGLTR